VPSPLTVENADRLLDMVEGGATRRELASEFGVHPRTITRWKALLGFEWVEVMTEEKRKLRRLWASGMTQEAIGEQLGVTATTIRRWRHQLGLPDRTVVPHWYGSGDPDGLRRQVERLVEAGEADVAIAKRLKLRLATVARLRREAGLFYRSPDPIDAALLKRLFATGLSDRQIAEVMGTTAATIQVKRSQLRLLRQR